MRHGWARRVPRRPELRLPMSLGRRRLSASVRPRGGRCNPREVSDEALLYPSSVRAGMPLRELHRKTPGTRERSLPADHPTARRASGRLVLGHRSGTRSVPEGYTGGIQWRQSVSGGTRLGRGGGRKASEVRVIDDAECQCGRRKLRHGNKRTGEWEVRS
jgi:hypothetical protein